MKLIETDDWFESCDHCEANEGHYCLLYGATLKNTDIHTCEEYKPKDYTE